MATLKKKLVIVGDDLTGKTSILFASGNRTLPPDYVPTVLEYYSASIKIDEEVIELIISDTSGKTEYDSLRALTYRRADVILICFSIDNPESFQNVAEKWWPQVHHYGESQVPVLLVGNKKDMRYDLNQKLVTPSEGHLMATRIGVLCYVECSATTKEGIAEVMRIVALASVRKEPLSEAKKSKCILL